MCTPYYSARGLARLSKVLPPGVGLKFMSRISPSEWASGVSSPDELATQLLSLQEHGYEVQLLVHQRLHAKAYLADHSTGLVGSANLSSAGFDKHFELMLELTEDEARTAAKIIDDEASQSGKLLTPDSLNEWVHEHLPKIDEHKEAVSDLQDLADVQRRLDLLLGYGQGGAGSDQFADIDDFDSWLTANSSLAGAEVLQDRYRNISGQNLTGHFRQSYCAVCRFLREYPDHVDHLVEKLNRMGSDDIYQPTRTVLDDWVRHLNDHATIRTDLYDYAVLRGILPPNLGGTRIGGGGGSSTLKRMLPLAARFMVEEGR